MRVNPIFEITSTLFLFLLLTSLSAGAMRAEKVSIRVAAAADLTDAFKEVAELFTRRTGCKIELIFGASGQLTQQIEHGAPYDVFASASNSYIQQLTSKKLTISDTDKIYAIGSLVVWIPAESKLSIKKISDLNSESIYHISIANPQHAPYGKAAVEALKKAGIYTAITPKLVYGENVRQAFQFAQTGNAEAAIVSASMGSGKGKKLPIPVNLYRPIEQSVAVLCSTRHEKEARSFTKFLQSVEGKSVLKRYSFRFPPEKKQKISR